MKLKLMDQEKDILLDYKKVYLSNTLEFLGYKANTVVVEVNDLIVNSKNGMTK